MNYNVSQCAQEVNECWKNLHTKAMSCAAQIKSMPGAQACLAQPEEKAKFEAFQTASFAWHKSVDECLSGAECHGDHCVSEAAASRIRRVSRNIINYTTYNDHSFRQNIC